MACSPGSSELKVLKGLDGVLEEAQWGSEGLEARKWPALRAPQSLKLQRSLTGLDAVLGGTQWGSDGLAAQKRPALRAPQSPKLGGAGPEGPSEPDARRSAAGLGGASSLEMVCSPGSSELKVLEGLDGGTRRGSVGLGGASSPGMTRSPAPRETSRDLGARSSKGTRRAGWG